MATLNVENWALKSLILNTADMEVPNLKANANDMYGRGIDLHVMQDGSTVDMTGMLVYLVWRHQNGNQDITAFEEVDASDGNFRVYYPPAMMYGGNVVARISIFIGDEKQTGSLNFTIVVEPNPLNEDEALSDENFSFFLAAVESLNNLEATLTAAEAERQANEETRIANEEQRVANEETRIANETARATAETARATAEATRVSNEETRQTNESTRQTNETTRQENEETRQSNEAAREESEDARVDEYATLRSNVQSSISAANTAAEAALAAAATASDMVRDAVLSEDTAASIDTLAKNVCTSGVYIAGIWYVKSSAVDYSDGVLTVNGASYLASTNRLRLPSSSCAASSAYALAESADATAAEAMQLLESALETIAYLQAAVSVLALNAGSYPFVIGTTMYLRNVSYASGVLTIPTASYSDGRMLIGAM